MKITIHYTGTRLESLTRAYHDVRDELTPRQWNAIVVQFRYDWSRAAIPTNTPGIRIRRLRMAYRTLTFCLDFTGISGYPVRAVARVLRDAMSKKPRYYIDPTAKPNGTPITHS